MNIDFTGKKALVTGAGRGIGRRIALDLAHGGAHVFALSRTKAHLDSLLLEYNGVGKIEVVCVDLEDIEASRNAVEDLGPIDLLVNNAGICTVVPFDEMKMEQFDQMMNINVKGVINLSQVVIKGMKKRGQGGSIVNVSSISSMQGEFHCSGYSSTKSALDKLTEIMAVEFGPYQIRVNSVNPQVVLTDMMYDIETVMPGIIKEYADNTPLKRVCNVEDVSNVVLFLLSEKASMVTGSKIPVDGGILAGKPPGGTQNRYV